MKTFAGAKAAKTDSADSWTVEDLLRELLAQLESGDWKPTRTLLLWEQHGPEGEIDHGFWAAGVSDIKTAAWMCDVHKFERMFRSMTRG